MNKTVTKTIKLPPDLQAELDAMPDNLTWRKLDWTDEMDALLLAAWPIKQKRDVLALFQRRYGVKCVDTLRCRYRAITEAK